MLGQRGVRARRHLGQQRRLLGRADPGRLAGTGTGRHLAQVPALPPAQQRRPVDAEEGGDLAHRAAGVELPQGTFAEVAGVLLHPRSVAQDATCPQSALKMGYASAIAWVMFLIVLVLTLVVFRTRRYWVHLESEGGKA